MKFGKNLQRVIDITDPEWVPYWTNYKMLKKLIKELPSIVSPNEKKSIDWSKNSDVSSTDGREQCAIFNETAPAASSSKCAPNNEINKSPGEKAFFKLLHSELKKTAFFFGKAQQEFVIREERVREGMEIIKCPNSIMVSDKWPLLAKSLYRLYKDLLLLETYAIMTYCSFSKILKKHDKVTGYETRNAFMVNIVNKASFTNYPLVIEMIQRCEVMYEEVSQHLLMEGKVGLYEDERLFINMIHRLNEQCMDTAAVEGVPEQKKSTWRPQEVATHSPSRGHVSEWKLSSLQRIVEDMGAQNNLGQISDDCPPAEEGQKPINGKRKATDSIELEKGKRFHTDNI